MSSSGRRLERASHDLLWENSHYIVALFNKVFERPLFTVKTMLRREYEQFYPAKMRYHLTLTIVLDIMI
jgi:hypothetical protein